MTPPILICGFNRPDCLRRVFDVVRVARPQELFLVLDAPREGREGDVAANEACKRVFQSVNWDCNVHRNYAERNMGCKRRMETGITEMFNYVEFGLVFEDDCVAHPDFFRFADEMFERYKNDERVGMLASSAPSVADPGIPRDVSYYFDRFPYIWGWGTWKRAWQKYERVASVWDSVDKDELIGQIFPGWWQRRKMIRHFDRICKTEHVEWDSTWWLSCLYENMLCIHPSANLMSNIGYIGLHAAKRCAGVHDRTAIGMQFPLTHPRRVEICRETERLLSHRYSPTFIESVIGKLNGVKKRIKI